MTDIALASDICVLVNKTEPPNEIKQQPLQHHLALDAAIEEIMFSKYKYLKRANQLITQFGWG
jgi:hypothetical protein